MAEQGINGTSVLLLVDIGGGNLSPVASQRDASMTETTAEIDVSSKDQREGRVRSGRYTCTIALDFLYVRILAQFVALRNAMRQGLLIKIQRSEDGTNIEQADALITDLSSTFPDQGEALVSASLTLDGEWVDV